ncbi:caspase family protein [Halochromatium salexigens]|uniref:EF-hand domain-containing protein n=1 Tax=Halochromatium salexigens TaxID=49447 RepID=A0AAJ0XH43_HALSE|nr:caspase family protein [Halochromatium salexigens]MBK5931651.1 hypothetical protein [Halochromatium salexigens]
MGSVVRPRPRNPLWGLVLLLALAATSVQAETRALVIGIDEYEHMPLHGAVSDASDIEQSLRMIGVRDLVKRLDTEATRERLSADWQALIERSKPGDMIVLTFAGHGSQEPERIEGSEADGLDEVLLMFNFDEKEQRPAGRLYDDELHGWFTKANERDISVLFIADSCHSGTLTRSVDPRASGLTYRNYAYTIPDEQLSLEPPSDLTTGAPEELENVTFFAAAQDHEQVPEVLIYDKQTGEPAIRGALSWAFSRALEGPADKDGDGMLSLDELKHYLRSNVRAKAQSRQTPNLLPEGKGQTVVLPIASLRSPQRPTTWPKPHIKLLGDPFASERLSQDLDGVINRGVSETPDIIFDLNAREAVSHYGDVIARDLEERDIRAVIEKWQAIERLNHERSGDRLSTRILPDDGTHRRGEQVSFYFGKIELPYFALFSLSGNGTVHFHYPLDGDPQTIPLAQPLQLSFEVMPPYGADQMIAVTSSEPLPRLIERLRELDGTQNALAAAEATLNALRSGGRQLGLQGLYTAP